MGELLVILSSSMGIYSRGGGNSKTNGTCIVLLLYARVKYSKSCNVVYVFSLKAKEAILGRSNNARESKYSSSE